MEIEAIYLYGIPALFGAVSTVVMSFLNPHFPKYMPSIIMGICTIGMFISVKWFTTAQVSDLEALKYAMFFGSFALSALITAIIMDFLKNKLA